MTVINTMKFNEKEGGMVADSQSSTSLRKYDLADKIIPLSSGYGSMILAGGTGVSDFLYEASEILRKQLSQEKNYNVTDTANTLAEVMIQMKRQKIETHLKTKYGIS